jgi:hypothetical protein
MRQQVPWILAVLTLCAAGCREPVIKEIEIRTACPCPPGSQIRLALEVESKEAVTYQWHSDEGGSFDYPESPEPRFTAPETRTVHIQCAVIIAGKPVIRHATLPVSLAAPAPSPQVTPPEATPAPQSSRPVPTPAPAAAGAVFDIERNGFVASGWMGDGLRGRQFLSPQFNSEDELRAHPNCERWTYRPGGDQGWAAVAWQNPSNNWGSSPGVNLAGRRFSEVVVSARGIPDSQGNFPKVTFKAGGGTDPSKPHQDSFGVEMREPVTLTAEWREYRLNLKGQNLSSVITGFIFTVELANNRNGATFCLADIRYQ